MNKKCLMILEPENDKKYTEIISELNQLQALDIEEIFLNFRRHMTLEDAIEYIKNTTLTKLPYM